MRHPVYSRIFMHRRLIYYSYVRLNRTFDEYDGDDEGSIAADKDDGGVMGMATVEQVQDICAYSRHQGLGHKISGRSPFGAHLHSLIRNCSLGCTSTG